MQRTMDLAALVEARAACDQRISWNAIFVRAYALVAARHRELRRTYMPFLGRITTNIPLMLQLSVSNASMLMKSVCSSQNCSGQNARHLSRSTVRSACSSQSQSSLLMHSRLRLRLGQSIMADSSPAMVGALNLDGATRATQFGTFGVSTAAAFGGASLFLISPLSTTLNYGQLQSNVPWMFDLPMIIAF